MFPSYRLQLPEAFSQRPKSSTMACHAASARSSQRPLRCLPRPSCAFPGSAHLRARCGHIRLGSPRRAHGIQRRNQMMLRGCSFGRRRCALLLGLTKSSTESTTCGRKAAQAEGRRASTASAYLSFASTIAGLLRWCHADFDAAAAETVVADGMHRAIR